MDFTDRVITKSQNLLIVSSEHLLQPFDSNLWTSMFLDLKKLPSASSNLAALVQLKRDIMIVLLMNLVCSGLSWSQF